MQESRSGEGGVWKQDLSLLERNGFLTWQSKAMEEVHRESQSVAASGGMSPVVAAYLAAKIAEFQEAQNVTNKKQWAKYGL